MGNEWIVYVNKYDHEGSGVARIHSRYETEVDAKAAATRLKKNGYRFAYWESHVKPEPMEDRIQRTIEHQARSR